MQKFIRRQSRVTGVKEPGMLDRLTGQQMELARVRLQYILNKIGQVDPSKWRKNGRDGP